MPFNNLIVPKHLTPGSYSWIESLFSNQDKLVTGFDLYNTIRQLAIPYSKKKDSTGRYQKIKPKLPGYKSGIPNWSFDLLNEKVPTNRSCQDAKIPIEFCPCLEERKDLMPYFYVGHAEE